MSLLTGIRWTALAVFALALAMLFVAVSAPASPLTLTDKLERAARTLHSPKEPVTDARELAEAIATASKGDPTIAAAMLTTAWAETALADRLRRNECRPLECDRRRAWGLWQQHKDAHTAAAWGSPDVSVQAAHAARAIRSAFYTCKAAHAPFPEGMLRLYGGRNCTAPTLPREALRVQIYASIRRQL